MKSLHMRFIAGIKKNPPRSSMWDLDIQAWRSDGYERDHVKKKQQVAIFGVVTRIHGFSHTLKVKVLLVQYSNNFEYLMFLPQITINFLSVFIIGQ